MDTFKKSPSIDITFNTKVIEKHTVIDRVMDEYMLDPIVPETDYRLPDEMIDESGYLKEEYCHHAFFAPIKWVENVYNPDSEEYDLREVGILSSVSPTSVSYEGITYGGYYSYSIYNGIFYEDWG